MSESPSAAVAASSAPSNEASSSSTGSVADSGASGSSGSARNDALLIVFGLLFLSGPFVFTLQWIVGLVYVAITTVAMVYLLCKAETVVDRLSKGEDRFAAAVKPEVSEVPATPDAPASASESAAAAAATAGAESGAATS